MVTGDASVNADAPIICCTAEILANIALREGPTAAVDLVISDEFHFIADRDRGWAWQITVSELPQAQFMIMSATLGDVRDLTKLLEQETGRTTAVIANAPRPVPLDYTWAITPIHDTITELVRDGQSPLYIVHPSQAAATERAQALTSYALVDKERRRAITAAIGGFRFAPGFGQTLRRLLTAGVGVHHAGMLPKYRRLVETLSQRGLLVAICGTDTLGVGINLPIRTVLFTSLTKFDGRRDRLLRAREFHQIAGRAGRPGFDTVGHVVAQASDHDVENERLALKFAHDPKKLRSVRKKKPADGTITYSESNFTRLIESLPEALHANLHITHAMVINLLHRDQDTAWAIRHIVMSAVGDIRRQHRLYRQAARIGRGLIAAGIVVRRESPTEGGRLYDLAEDLQADFALNQALSAFALQALARLDPDTDEYAMDMISVIESTLEDPRPILLSQQRRVRGEAIAEMKADGIDYADRMAMVEDISWPKPLEDFLESIYTECAASQPWITEHPLSPKLVARDMIERAMTFGEFVAYHQAGRSEGLVLRYLSDAYKALRQTVPEPLQTSEFEAVVTWLGQIVRLTDSSLVDEWEKLTNPAPGGQPADQAPVVDRRLTSNPAGFTVMIRNAMFQRVLLAARDDVTGLVALDGDNRDWTADDWDRALGSYWDEHDRINTDADARGPQYLSIDRSGPIWQVRQTIDDPDGNHDWAINATVDPGESDEQERLMLTIVSFERNDGGLSS
jgi:hypothetical protein